MAGSGLGFGHWAEEGLAGGLPAVVDGIHRTSGLPSFAAWLNAGEWCMVAFWLESVLVRVQSVDIEATDVAD